MLSFSSASVAQLVEQGTENPRVVGSIPTGGTICGFSSSGRAPPCQGGGSEFEPRHPLHFLHKERHRVPYSSLWYRGQVVRQGSAKPSFPSSNLGGTSILRKHDRCGRQKFSIYRVFLHIWMVLRYCQVKMIFFRWPRNIAAARYWLGMVKKNRCSSPSFASVSVRLICSLYD